METEYHLHPGQSLVLALPAGSEVFCATGALRLDAFPGPSGQLPAPHGLAPGQGWRACDAAILKVQALLPSRCLMTLAPVPAAASGSVSPNENSLLLWGRRLWGALRAA